MMSTDLCELRRRSPAGRLGGRAGSITVRRVPRASQVHEVGQLPQPVQWHLLSPQGLRVDRRRPAEQPAWYQPVGLVSRPLKLATEARPLGLHLGPAALGDGERGEAADGRRVPLVGQLLAGGCEVVLGLSWGVPLYRIHDELINRC